MTTFTLVAVMFTALLIGGAAQAAPRPAGIVLPASNANAETIYVSQTGRTQVLVLDAHGRTLGSFGSKYRGPTIATDQNGNIYVAGYGEENSLQVFHSPRTSDFTLIALPTGQQALDVMVDIKTGIFAVVSAQNRGPSEVHFFQRGATKACRVVSALPTRFVFGGAGGFDRDGTLYTEVKTINSGDVLVSITGGCKNGRLEMLSFKRPFQLSGRLRFNKANNLVIEADEYPRFPLLTFAHPINGEFSDPIATTTFTYQGDTPGFTAFTEDGSRFMVVDQRGVAQYRYPDGGDPEMIRRGLPATEDAVISPPLSP